MKEAVTMIRSKDGLKQAMKIGIENARKDNDTITKAQVQSIEVEIDSDGELMWQIALTFS